MTDEVETSRRSESAALSKVAAAEAALAQQMKAGAGKLSGVEEELAAARLESQRWVKRADDLAKQLDLSREVSGLVGGCTWSPTAVDVVVWWRCSMLACVPGVAGMD